MEQSVELASGPSQVVRCGSGLSLEPGKHHERGFPSSEQAAPSRQLTSGLKIVVDALIPRPDERRGFAGVGMHRSGAPPRTRGVRRPVARRE
jgi:hypothetical protein